MSPVFHYEFEQNTTAWLSMRAGKVTASEIQRIITPKTLKSSESSLGYANRLIAERILGRALQDSDYQSQFMELGRDNEAATVAAFEFQTELETSVVGFVERADGLAGCSPDRIIKGLASLEVKSPSAPIHVGYLLDPASLRDKYRLQSQFQMSVCEFDLGYICSNHNPLPPVILQVDRDEELIGKINSAVKVVTDYVLDKYFELEQKYGPFTKTEPKQIEDALMNGMDVTEADIDDLVAKGILA